MVEMCGPSVLIAFFFYFHEKGNKAIRREGGMRDGAPEGLKRKEWSEVILGLCQGMD